MREFKLPDVGEGVHEGELIEWLVSEGDAVTEDQPVAKVETDKALVDVPAPVNGTVRELRWSEGDVVPVGEVLLVFDVEGEVDEAELEVEPEPAEGGAGAAGGASDGTAGGQPAGGATGERDTGAASGDEAAAEASDQSDTGQRPTGAGQSAPEGGAGGRVFAAPSARRLARELAVDIDRVEGSGPGGRITEDDVYAAAEEDEGGIDAATESSGGAEESIVEPEQADAGGGRTTADQRAAASRGESADRERTLATPATRRVAEEAGVDIDAVPAVEERDGEAFVTEEAVREYAAAQQRAQAADAAEVSTGAATEARTADAAASTDAETAGEPGPPTAPGGAGTARTGDKPEQREPYRGVRKTIGDAMAASKYTAPHVTHHDEVDVTRLVETKERLAERAEERGIRLTYTPFVLKAVVGALKEYPILNSQLDEDAEEIVYNQYYDLGVATATDAGLMVPVLEAADQKGLLQIASELAELVEKARNRTIAPEELRGSTFTVTNVGAIGGEYATPIINQPEVAILALGQIRRKPRVVEDEDGTESIEPRSIMPLSLSFDHRVVDGAVGARFTNAVRERLRDPELLLID